MATTGQRRPRLPTDAAKFDLEMATSTISNLTEAELLELSRQIRDWRIAKAAHAGYMANLKAGQEGALAHRDLLRGVAELPEEQREVLLLVAVEDFSYREAAGVLGVPIGTVMSRLSRGREQLRLYMNGDRIRARRRAMTVT